MDILCNQTVHWRNEVLCENILYNTELDNYLTSSGFLENLFVNVDLLNYLSNCINLKSCNLIDFGKVNLFERGLSEIKGLKSHKYLDIYKSEKRYIIIVSSISIIVFYIKKGKTVDSMDFGFGRLSVHNGFDLSISEFDKKLSELLSNTKKELI